LVVDVGVEFEFADEGAGGGVENSDFSVVDEEPDFAAFVSAAESDVVHSRVVADGDDAGVVDAVFADSPMPVGAGWGCFAASGVGGRWGAAVQGPVRPDRVVVVPECVELRLQGLDGVGRRLFG
jgi:hypothetical protein